MDEFVKHRIFDCIDNEDYPSNATLARSCTAKFNTKNGMVFILCSGGNSTDEQKISQLAIDYAKTFFNANFYSTPKEALKKAFAFVNQRLNFTGLHNPLLAKKGISCIMCLLNDNLLYYAYSGDAWFFLKKGDTFSQLTANLSLVQTSLDDIVPNYSNRPLGLDPLLVNVFVCEIPILPENGDMMLFGIGFVFQRVSEKEIKNILTKEKTIDEKADLLLEAFGTSTNNDTAFQLLQFKNLKAGNKIPAGFDEIIIEIINFMTSKKGMTYILVFILIGASYVLGREMKECNTVTTQTNNVIQVPKEDNKITDTTIIYVVRDDKERITEVAKRFNVNAEKLMEQNSKITNVLKAGEELKIKVKAVYIYNGEKTIREISQMYNVPVNLINKANNINDSSVIKTPKEIFIPLK